MSSPAGSLIPEARPNSDSSLKPIPKLALAATLTAFAVVAGAVSFQFFPLFQPPPELMIPSPPDHIAVAREASLWNCRLANSQLWFTGIFAAGVGGAWAALSAWRIRGKFSPPVAFFLGAIIAAAISGLAVFLAHLIIETSSDELVKALPALSPETDYRIYITMACQLVLMSLVGVGLGLAVGIGCMGKSRISTFAINGFGAGICAAVLYILTTSLALPDSQTDFLIPGGVLDGARDYVILAIWFGAMALAYSFIIPMQSKKPAA